LSLNFDPKKQQNYPLLAAKNGHNFETTCLFGLKFCMAS
jgi:hypothetical protein